MRRIHRFGPYALASLVLCVATPLRAVDSVPQSATPADLRIMGEALETALPGVGKTYGVELRAARELAAQRVTIIGKGMPLRVMAAGVRGLLSAGPHPAAFWDGGPDIERPDEFVLPANADAPVTWFHSKGGYYLGSTPQRRKLVERLQTLDLENYRKFVEAQVTWFQRDGQRALQEGVVGGEAGATRVPRSVVLERFSYAGILSSLGPDGRERLLAGTPFVSQVGKIPDPMRSALREYLVKSTRVLEVLPAGEADRCWLVILGCRDPLDPKGGGLALSVVHPDGHTMARMSGGNFTIPHTLIVPSTHPGFELQPPDAKDPSRRLTLNLTPEPGAPRGGAVRRSLNQVLETLAEGTGIHVVADGYLRPLVRFPANLQLRDYPRTQLLNHLAAIWGFDWRFSDTDEKVLLVRSRAWWMEDAADVPDARLQTLRDALGPGKQPGLEALLQVAELTEAQAQMLAGSGFVPAADGLVRPGWHDGTGIKPALRFFSRLPKPLQLKAQSQDGLPLRDAPPQLVQQWLLPTLLAECGAVTPELRQEMVFHLRPGKNRGNLFEAAPLGWEVGFVNPKERGPQWVRYIQPPAPSLRPGK